MTVIESNSWSKPMNASESTGKNRSNKEFNLLQREEKPTEGTEHLEERELQLRSFFLEESRELINVGKKAH